MVRDDEATLFTGAPLAAVDRAKLEGEAGGEKDELDEMDRRRSVGEADDGAKLNVRGEPLIGVGASMPPLSVEPFG